MVRPYVPIFKNTPVAAPSEPGHNLAAIKTYRYLRLGMLVAVAALAFSVVQEYRQPKVHCFLGSISGYYYTPVHSVFISAMVAIGVALIVIKGRTAVEDAFLSLAGMMAPVVAFLPTSDDPQGVCRSQMRAVGRYQPPSSWRFIDASINNNLYALVFAGAIAVVLVLVAFLIPRLRRTASTTEYKTGTWINLAGGAVLVVTGWILLSWAYSWVLRGHAKAACAMFAFLAGAAVTNSWFGFKHKNTRERYAWTYGIVGASMIVAGVLFVVVHVFARSNLNRHLVLYIEATEILLFVIYWSVQTVERWKKTV